MIRMPALIIHGHFYQPPRENPWTGTVDEEPSAAPFHDWNERIHAECYQPNSAVPTDENGVEVHAINNYEHISFNFGPTLLSWIEQHHPTTYRRIIDADQESAKKRQGHGNAIAQAFGHAILPLCNERDLRTQIRWGVADFSYRFGRDPEAMWLPETACNDRVMGALIDEGLQYVILAPHQASRVRSDRHSDWMPVNENSINTGIAYRYLHPDSQKSMAVFFYQGQTSRAIAFEKLLRSSRDFVDALRRAAGNSGMISVATDGETYGHHFKFGDLCLAHTVTEEAPARGFAVTNYSEFLTQQPAEFEVEINNGPNGEGTSWSCSHGVGRWIRDCGCHTGGEPGWNQAWRKPLRDALDFLRDRHAPEFEATRGGLFNDPWQARDDSVALILNSKASRARFLFDHAGRYLTAEESSGALTYLEAQRMLLLMYTSCGWFFNDISGIETLQILKYAARALELIDNLGLPAPRAEFMEILSEAKSNRPELGNGADIFRALVREPQPIMRESLVRD